MQINQEAIETLKSYRDDEPIFMLNYLKYKNQLEATGKSGEETYAEYLMTAAPFFEGIQSEIIFKGKPQATILGPSDEKLWDELLIVKYGNKNEFFKLMSIKNYPFELRASALEDSRLIVCK